MSKKKDNTTNKDIPIKTTLRTFTDVCKFISSSLDKLHFEEL
jgi:hypothetical protein